MTGRYPKLTKSVPLKSIPARAVARAFTEEGALSYGPPKHLLFDNESYFNSKHFTLVCAIHNEENKLTTIYRLRTDDQVERYDSNHKAALKNYPDDPPYYWDLYGKT